MRDAEFFIGIKNPSEKSLAVRDRELGIPTFSEIPADFLGSDYRGCDFGAEMVLDVLFELIGE